MKKFDLMSVKLKGGYLKKVSDLNENITLDAVYDRFSETGRIAACACTWKEGSNEPKPHIFWDSDVVKWMEGACYTIAKHPERTDLLQKVDAIIDDFEKNQWEDGYINSYYTAVEPQNRFTHRGCHELYCAGHMIEAAIAYAIATKSNRFIDITDKYISLIDRLFRVERSTPFLTPGHEEIELALVKLYRFTGKKSYLTLAKFFIDERANEKQLADRGTQSHAPVREQFTAEGHSVRAGYLYTAMADLAVELNDNDLLTACDALYEDIVNKKMYITGGIGSSPQSECFTNPYDLPNDTAYAETCAAVSLMLFADRMQNIRNSSTYADTIERAFYNGVMSGLSLDGKKFFYENPLEITMSDHFEGWGFSKRYPITQRVECFNCSCCPPNLNRILAQIEQFIYGYDDGVLFVNQFATSELDGNGITASTVADYPRSGNVSVTAAGVKKVAIRIPGWCNSFKANKKYECIDGYAYFEIDGEIRIEFDMSPFAVRADERVCHNIGTLALQRGPEVYACEGIDNEENLHALALDADFDYTEKHSDELDCTTLEVKGYRYNGKQASLYKKADAKENMYTCTEIKLIPYRTFANRSETDMLVWLREK